MKRIIALALSLMILMTLFGCAKGPNNETNNTTPSNSQTQNNPTDDNKTTEPSTKQDDEITPDNWGVTDHFAADNDKPSESFYINFPHFGGAARGYGLGGNQGDDTTAYVFGQNDYAPTINSISELFPAYFEQVQYTLEKAYGLKASNFEFSLSDDEPAAVGEYEMHTFTGKIAFDYEGAPKNYSFVAYATTLKSNGAYAYWVVYDTSDGQTNGTLIAEHALNMAKTFREEQ